MSHMTHKRHIKFISFNATMLNGSLSRKRRRKTAFIDQRAVAAGKKLFELIESEIDLSTFLFPFQVSDRGRREDGEPTAGAAVPRLGQVTIIIITRPKSKTINIINY